MSTFSNLGPCKWGLVESGNDNSKMSSLYMENAGTRHQLWGVGGGGSSGDLLPILLGSVSVPSHVKYSVYPLPSCTNPVTMIMIRAKTLAYVK
jgi:hypothetical protein